MTNMLPRDRAELIMAEHAAGKSIRGIAAAYGHSTQTVRDYVLGRRTPGEPAARDDDFAPFAAYCRRRLADDPHLRAAAGESLASFLGRLAAVNRARPETLLERNPAVLVPHQDPLA